MTTTRVESRASVATRAPGRLERALGAPLAFALTAAILMALFSWTFLSEPGRVAPTKDPAYYTWRTELLLSEEPVRLLEVEGALDMFAGGYRVSAVVLGAFLRTIADVSPLKTTVFLMAALPVLTALLLAGFAYRQRRDPLMFHVVAFASAGMLLTPPFVGYLDNLLALFFLAAAIWFLAPSTTSWAARAAFFALLLAAGFTHPTTLAIFGVTVALMAGARLLARGSSLRSVLARDGAMVATAFAAALATYAVWKVGPWGQSASLGESALPPPYGSDFFVDRMLSWVDQMRPLLNAPLLVAGLAGLLASGRNAVEDDLARVAVVWLAPLAGLFGFVGGLTYPYYRFFNTTLAWVLLIGVGAFFLLRLFLSLSARGGGARVASLGVAAIVVVLGANLYNGFQGAGWNEPAKGWLSPAEQRDLDAVRGRLEPFAEDDVPVVFVIDDEPAEPFQIWGFTKLSGNTSRYGLPHGLVDRGYLYLGSLENYLEGRPTQRGEETYDRLSPALLADAQEGIEEARGDSIVVVAEIFNRRGANSDVFDSETSDPPAASTAPDVWLVADGRVTDAGGPAPPRPAADPLRRGSSVAAWARIVAGLVLLLVPGALALPRFVPSDPPAATSRRGFWDSLGMVAALSSVLLFFSGFVVLAVARQPFSPPLAWTAFGAATLAGAVVGLPAILRERSSAKRRAPAEALS